MRGFPDTYEELQSVSRRYSIWKYKNSLHLSPKSLRHDSWHKAECIPLFPLDFHFFLADFLAAFLEPSI